MTALEEIKKALAAAEQFIVNGVELGYIRMPNPETPDSANDTLPMIRQAQTALESLQRDNEELRQRLDVGPCGEDAIDVAESAADHLRHRAEAAEDEVKHYRVALIAAKTRMRNCRGAIESDQVVDKDVHGSLGNGIRDIQDALASTGGEHHEDK